MKKAGKTKTTTIKRVVPLNSTAIEMTLDLRNEYYFGEDSPLVCNANGDYANPTNLRKRLYRIEDTAEITTKGLRAFRHTFATVLYNSGADINTAQSLLGHSSINITLEIYTHLEKKKKVSSIEKINEYLNQNQSKFSQNKKIIKIG